MTRQCDGKTSRCNDSTVEMQLLDNCMAMELGVHDRRQYNELHQYNDDSVYVRSIEYQIRYQIRYQLRFEWLNINHFINNNSSLNLFYVRIAIHWTIGNVYVPLDISRLWMIQFFSNFQKWLFTSQMFFNETFNILHLILILQTQFSLVNCCTSRRSNVSCIQNLMCVLLARVQSPY